MDNMTPDEAVQHFERCAKILDKFLTDNGLPITTPFDELFEMAKRPEVLGDIGAIEFVLVRSTLRDMKRK